MSRCLFVEAVIESPGGVTVEGETRLSINDKKWMELPSTNTGPSGFFRTVGSRLSVWVEEKVSPRASPVLT